MSLVGTRPPTVDEWDKYELHHRARLATKPGLTGMWQVSGRSNITDLEAMSKGIPVITINKFGGATLFDENTGWLYEGNSKEEYIENLKKAILECIANPGEVIRRGKNARKKAEKYTWQEKNKKYQAIYVVGHAGRFSDQKNHSFLLDIFQAVHRKNPNTVLLLFGVGELQEAMKNKARTLGIEDAVIFYGASNEMNKMWQASDITVFDCYEYSKITGRKDDNRGYSSIFVHTEKGGKILEAIKSHIEIQEEDVNSLVTENGVMVCNSAKPHPRRAEFYQLAEHYPIDKALNKIDPITLKDKIIEKSKRFLFKTGLITVARHLNKGKKVEVVENK